MELDSGDHKMNHSNLETDAKLFQDLKVGQTAALGVLYDRYASLVYRLALRILANPQEAEDLTQEVFLILWRGSTYNPARGSLGSFLTVLTRSRAIDRLRSRSTNSKLLQQWGQTMTTEPFPLTPFELASLEQRSEYVRKALDQLSQEQQQVLTMAYYDGLSQSEIAAQSGIPLGTIKTRSRKGLLNLRKHLKDFLE